MSRGHRLSVQTIAAHPSTGIKSPIENIRFVDNNTGLTPGREDKGIVIPDGVTEASNQYLHLMH